MQSGNKIIIESFVFEDFVSPVVKINPPVTEDFSPPINQFSRRRMSDAVLAEWEQACFKDRRLCVYEEN